MGATVSESVRKSWIQTLFGNDLKSGKAWSLVALRFALGFMFLYGGYEKIQTELGGGYATSDYLTGIKGPFAFMFTAMSGNPAVEYLLVYGELLIGLSLILGVVTRVGGVSGAVMSLLLYMSRMPVQGPKVPGSYFDYLLTSNALINQYIIYVLVFAAFVFLVPGRFFGVDRILQNSSFVNRRPALKRLSTILG